MTEFYAVLSAAEDSGAEADDADKAYALKIDKEFDECMSDDFNTALALSNLFGYFREIKKCLAEKDGKGAAPQTDGAKTAEGTSRATAGRAVAVAAQIRKTYSLLGLFERPAKEYLDKYAPRGEKIPADVKAIAEERFAARKEKDWAKSDRLRARLAELGYSVKDSKDGYELTKN